MRIRNKLVFFIPLMIITALILTLVIRNKISYDKRHPSEFKAMVTSASEYYSDIWELEFCSVWEDEKILHVTFNSCSTRSDALGSLEIIVNTYRTIYSEVYENEESPYQDYEMEILFFIEAYFQPRISSITKDLSRVQFYYTVPKGSSLADGVDNIPALLPELKELTLIDVVFSDYDNIAGFDSLECFATEKSRITEEDKKKILSHYPDCEIIIYQN